MELVHGIKDQSRNEGQTTKSLPRGRINRVQTYATVEGSDPNRAATVSEMKSLAGLDHKTKHHHSLLGIGKRGSVIDRTLSRNETSKLNINNDEDYNPKFL